MSLKPLSPKLVNNFLDTCAFDPKYRPEDEAAKTIRKLVHEEFVALVLTHSNQKEINHPNTPPEVIQAAKTIIYTLETELNQDEVTRKANIHTILTGDGKPENYAADADHIFEAGKYGGYFITTDKGILKKRNQLEQISGGRIFKPTEWLELYKKCAEHDDQNGLASGSTLSRL